jgi:serine/threonine protein kinase
MLHLFDIQMAFYYTNPDTFGTSEPLHFSDFKTKNEKLDEGTRGHIYKALHLQLNRVFAFKIYFDDMIKNGKDEIAVYRKLAAHSPSSPNLLTLHGYFYKNNTTLILVFDLAETNVYKQLRIKKTLSEVTVKSWIQGTVAALHHLHSRCIIHRDVKSENIVLVNDIACLIDFDLSIDFDRNDYSFKGTLIL